MIFGLFRLNGIGFLLLLLICHSGRAQTGKYPVRNFTPADYKAGIQNIDFAQNRDMDLFVANNLGILSFNGREWEQHALNTGQKQRSLAFDESTNRLYTGSQGDFGYFEGDWQFTSLKELIPQENRSFDEVWSVYLHKSRVYFCTFQAIYAYDGESVQAIRHPEGFNRTFSAGNRLFTQSPSGRIMELTDDGLVASYPQKRAGVVSGMIPYDNGFLLFYNSGHIEFTSANGSFDTFPELVDKLRGTYVNHVAALGSTRLVITTQQAGVFLFDLTNGKTEHISVREGLQTNACLKTYQDYDGNLWVGMQNGIAMLDINSAARFVNREINVQGSGYEAYETTEGTYFTTSNGIYFLPEEEDESFFLEGSEGPAYGLELIGGKLYAGHHTGLFLLENGRAVRIALTDGLWRVKPLKSRPGYVIGGTYAGLVLFRMNESGILVYDRKIGGFEESSRFFEEGRDGSVWVGQFYKGLFKLTLSEDLNRARATLITPHSDLPMQDHLILADVDQEILIGTEKGVYLMNQETDSIYKDPKLSEIIGPEWVYALHQDKQDNIHIFTQDKVGFFRKVSDNYYTYVPSTLYPFRFAFNNDLLHISAHVSDGILFNANEGFIRYDPALEALRHLHKKPLIRKISGTGDDNILMERLPFDPFPSGAPRIEIIEGTRVLRFEVEAFNFDGSNHMEFRYFLEGFDEDFGDWTTSPVKEYTNLETGTYQFQVQTLNNLGEPVTGDPVVVVVSPPLYKSVGARISYVVAGLLLLSGIYWSQQNRFRTKQHMLAEAKGHELEKQRNKVTELKKEQDRTELRHVSNLLAASTMNLVVKNEFIENVKEEIRGIKSSQDMDQARKALDKIIREIDTTLNVQEDWKQFEYHFDKVHGDFLTRLTTAFTDLTPGEQKLCAFLRLKMDTKEIANLMGISLRGVEVARYRLRKKLNLDTHQNLSKFILEF